MHRDGALVETGPNSALDTTPLINELLDALGIRDERAEANAVAGTRYIVRDGKLVAAADVARRVPCHLGVHAGRQVPPLARAVRSPRATRRRGVDRRVRPAPARDRVSRLRGRPVRRGHLCGGPGADLRCPPRSRASTRSSRRYGSLIKGQFQGATRTPASARERRRNAARQLLLPQRHADADRCARAGGRRASRPASNVGRLEREPPTAAGP